MYKLNRFRSIASILALTATSMQLIAAAPKPRDKAPDFSLQTLSDQTVKLSELTSNGPVVLLVLRGWSGYQCPLCTAQVGDYIASASAFEAVGARVLMVYPGPASDLKAHASEFVSNKNWPKQFLLVTDPDYKMILSYDLRWNASGETAYPSTFIFDRKGIVRFAKISHSHGDRTRAAEIVAKLKDLPAN
jgi:peroxiredoxin